jgi:outer membrane protein assembly factor BamB
VSIPHGTTVPQSGQAVLAADTERTKVMTAAFTSTIYLPQVTSSEDNVSGGPDWTMVAANPQRTSWTSEEVSGNLHVEWYRPIEAYIPQHVQIITANGLLYISTARGLYAVRANTGAVAWRYDTEMPLGNSPTVTNGIVYVGGFDRKLHALDAIRGTHLWSFDGAQAGYDTNPLVVDVKVILGNRDGSMYAIGAHGTSRQGQLIWKYATGGPIRFSAAYKNGIVYFASNDNYAYALNASNEHWRKFSTGSPAMGSTHTGRLSLMSRSPTRIRSL